MNNNNKVICPNCHNFIFRYYGKSFTVYEIYDPNKKQWIQSHIDPNTIEILSPFYYWCENCDKSFNE